MYTTFLVRDRFENPVNLFYDDPADHPKDYEPRIKFQLDYEYLPNLENVGKMKLVNNPAILCGDTSTLKKEDIQKLKKWVKKHREVIFKWKGAEDDLPLAERFEYGIKYKQRELQGNEDEIHDPWWPMACVQRYSNDTKFGLPDELIVYIDDSCEYSYRRSKKMPYIPRIKFVGNPEEENRMFWIFIPMSIEENPKILMPEIKHLVSEESIEILKNWVKRYYKELLKVTYGEIDWIDFLSDIKENYPNDANAQDFCSLEDYCSNLFPKIKEKLDKKKYEALISKIKEDLLKLNFVEVPEFQEENMNGNLYQQKDQEGTIIYSALFKENCLRLVYEEDDAKFCDIEYDLYKENRDLEEYKAKGVSPEIAGFGLILFFMLRLKGTLKEEED